MKKYGQNTLIANTVEVEGAESKCDLGKLRKRYGGVD